MNRLEFFNAGSIIAQDSLKLHEVTIKAYPGNISIIRNTSSAVLINNSIIRNQPVQSLVPVLNTAPGVRMEERSPGSYRLSVRGSLLRSPFGVRNLKVYMDEFSLTNAGGETYINLLDINSVNSIEVHKGPDGSLFGANSGGVVRVDPFFKTDSSMVTAQLQAGSYGMLGEHFAIQKKTGPNILSISQAWQTTDGYREQSAMDRKFFQVTNRFGYSENSQLKILLFYSDLQYDTPGGLTLTQLNTDPKKARYATNILPGAVQQKTGIRNKTLFGGIVNEVSITPVLKHVISVFGSSTDFINPFITNFETRKELNGGTRTWIELKNKQEKIKLSWNLGGEMQQLKTKISNHDNRMGVKDTLRIADDAEAMQVFGFSRVVADLFNKWIIEASISYNYNSQSFKRIHPSGSNKEKRTFDPQFMPRISSSCLISRWLSIRAILSKGYSVPSLQETRSSSNEVNLALEPESGWNYEAGLRFNFSKFFWDISLFNYVLSDAIVRRQNMQGEEYFTNAGNTSQRGFESQINIDLFTSREKSIINGAEIFNAFTSSDFRFGNYHNGSAEITGNKITGVPSNVSVTGLRFLFHRNLTLTIQHNFTSTIPLNDQNSVHAKEYNLVQVMTGLKFKAGKLKFDVSAGIDNLLNEKYSLGNDLNAAGNRYYNAAPPLNYFARIRITI